MSLNSEQLNELLTLAKQASLAAGEVISDFQGKVLETKRKDTGSTFASQVVTEVDLEAEKAILAILGPSFKKYDLGLLTEEITDDQSRFEKEFFWCIDPLDGTLPFTKNESGYSTSIALVSRSGDAVLGVVYDPRYKNIYYALKGEGAFKNGHAFGVGEPQENINVIDGSGGAVMQALSTIELSPCVFYKRPKAEEGGGCLWDYAATSVIQREAGGKNSDFSGRAIDLNSAHSLFLNHCGIIYSSGLSEKEVFKVIHSR